MRKLILLGVLLAVGVGGTGQAIAEIGWAGNAFPNHGTVILPSGDQFVVAQVWKEGVTDADGQGADISAVISYQTNLMGAPVEVAMSYNTDVGANDEYIGYIPQAVMLGADYVDVTVIFTDLTDATTFEILGDQMSNPPPLRYEISGGVPVDVEVTFILCLSGAESSGDVCVTGSAPELTEWGNGVELGTVDGQEYQITVTFAAGSNPAVEYKYRKDGCDTWEGTPNRAFTLPTDGTNVVVLPPDSWENLPLGCGLGDILAEDKVVCFQVCMEGVENSGDICVTGNQSILSMWGNGVITTEIGQGLYQACVIFEAGSPVPGVVEYKFRKDGCENWESVDNRVLVVDNGNPAELTATHSWDDGPSFCEPVATQQTSWGALKSIYR